MAQRNVHYEAAFEDYLRCRGWPYVAVDETKKSIFADAAIKSFDFLVYSESGRNLLIDVKGRKFPDGKQGGAATASRAWENWITQDDARGLSEWEKVFGADFHAVIVFAYWLQGPPQRAPFDDVHLYRKRHYAYLGVPLADYLAASRVRSRKWNTITVPSKRLAKMARDIAGFL